MPFHPTLGFMLEQVSRVSLSNYAVAWGANRPDYFHHALYNTQVESLEVLRFSVEAVQPERYKAYHRVKMSLSLRLMIAL